MFFAPALRSNAMTAPNSAGSDFGLERFMRDLGTMPRFHDVEEDDQSWTLRMDIPGVPRDQLRVQVTGNRLEVESAKECPRLVRAAYELPADIDVERTEAHLQDGVLTLKLAKAASAVARRIEIQS